MNMEMKVIANIRSQFPERFGIPRQSGLVPSLRGEIHFREEFNRPEAVRGIEEFSYLWLLWGFSALPARRKGAVNEGENATDARGPTVEESSGISLTVAPPRLGGRERKGVFATRSPFRPNRIGLSSVRLEEVRTDNAGGPVLVISGADLLDGTPIYDIKPYLPYTDSHPDASSGFVDTYQWEKLPVVFPKELLSKLPQGLGQTIIDVLAQDPRAAYNKKPDYVYGMQFGGFDIRFTVQDGELRVQDVVDVSGGEWKRIKGL